MNEITLIIPYYQNPKMLVRQSKEWVGYPDEMRVVVVDDASPKDPTFDVLLGAAGISPDNIVTDDDVIAALGCSRADVLRIEKDIPWNRNGARNTGAEFATTKWLLHTDIDHILGPGDAHTLVKMELDPARWYRFARFRVGAADKTRQKDALPEDCKFGPIKPHVDSFLCTRELYWRAGGYDEDFSGGLGGSSLFLKHMKAEAGEPILIENIHLCVYTRSVCDDASDNTLDRSRDHYERIRAEKRAAGDPKAVNCCRQRWRHVL